MNYARITTQILIVFFSFLFVNNAAGQPTDLLLKKIENYKKRDSVKVELLVDYCVANTFSNSDKNL